MSKKLNILRVDSSAMGHEGQSALLATRIIENMNANQLVANIVTRDLTDGLPHLDQNWDHWLTTRQRKRVPPLNMTLFHFQMF